MAGGHSEALERGRAALGQGEWAEARRRFEQALGDEESPEAYEGLGVAARYALDPEAVFDAHERGYRLARARRDDVSAARLAVQLGYDAYAFRGPAEAQGWVERAAMLVDGRPASVASATVSLVRAHLSLLVDHDPKAARELTAGAITEARKAGAVDVEMQALALNGLARASLGELDAGLRALDAAVAAAVGGASVQRALIGASAPHVVSGSRRHGRATSRGRRPRGSRQRHSSR